MTQSTHSYTPLAFSRTKAAVLWTSILNEPLLTLYSLCSFILHKDLGATIVQIGILTMLRPMASLASMYWSAIVVKHPHRILSNVIWAGVLSRLPFFFFPFIHDPWLFILSIGFYMMFYRAGTPAWVEILKLNLPQTKRGSIYSWGSSLGYIEGVLLAIGVGYLLDHHSGAWRYMFPVTATIGMMGVFLQKRIPISIEKEEPSTKEPFHIKESLLLPWKEAWRILKEDKDFLGYQWAVMLCGCGVMIIQPALPLFFMDHLGLSYTDLAIALSIWKGIGFAMTSPIWGKYFTRHTIYSFSTVIFIFMGSFPLLLLFAPINTIWVYIAYLAYGIAQAGCHLSWNLSGPYFAKEKNSASYSSVNILMVGLRGSTIPALGTFLCALCGPISLLFLGGGLCLYSAFFIRAWHSRKVKNHANAL
jgi:hypothetical protein